MQFSKGRVRGGGDGSGPSDGHHEARGPAPTDMPRDVPFDDPWYDALASGWGEAGTGAVPVPAARQGQRPEQDDDLAAAEVYLEVQRSPAFQEVRSRYRRFVVPATVAFFLWYVAYVVAATAAPGLMARPVVGAVNVGLLAGLGQFLSTFLLTWAYARHARLRRDRAALELRWDTQELTRGARGGAA
ncbi:DUF485 domain-containing protein [Streptomyces longwoodensis]|uniref:DUF485 domain-containing protein n=1 Tax=Streptomyces longwoodensis TaxID=68231 RepID=UPI0022526225|nr:DUF485 domain-containing protein [Streptomyces longwoodensis]MCX4996378.1 DUF485 domain-containing protein [Streptomyces longwoodensis]WRY91072.1 DUF485 domain-containing protein [Streptomyces longwoodensis]